MGPNITWFDTKTEALEILNLIAIIAIIAIPGHLRRAPAWVLAPRHSGGFASGYPWWDSARVCSSEWTSAQSGGILRSVKVSDRADSATFQSCMLGIFHKGEMLAMFGSFTCLRNEPFKPRLPPQIGIIKPKQAHGGMVPAIITYHPLNFGPLLVWFLEISPVSPVKQSPWPGHPRSKLHKWDPHGTRCSAAHRGTRPGILRGVQKRELKMGHNLSGEKNTKWSTIEKN